MNKKTLQEIIASLDYEAIKRRTYEKYGGGVSLGLWESLRLHPTFDTDQTEFAFYNDGTESGAVIIGSIGADASNLSLDTVYHVRFEITETGGGVANNVEFQLEAQVDGGGYNNVTGSSTNVRSAAGGLVDGGDTTQRLGGGGTFIGGDGQDEVDGLAGGALSDWLGSEIGEVVFSFTLRSADLSGGESIDLRVAGLTAYTVADASLTVATPAPVLNQTSFRARVDDSAADNVPTWIAALNTNWTQDVDETFRIRFLVTESGGNAGTFGGRLQYNLASGGWNNVTSTSPIQASAGAVADGRATGQVLGVGTNVAGEYDEVDGNVANISLTGSDETEVEYNLLVDKAQVSDGQTFQLRVVGHGDDTTVLDNYTNTPTVTVNEDVLVQDKFRFRYDNGSETLADWIEAEDTNTVLNTDTNYRIRFNIRETGNKSVSPQFQLQYNKNSGGWNDVNGSSTNVRSSASTQFADGAVTTEQLAGTGTFTAGRMEEVDGRAASITLNNQDTEVEYCFQVRGVDVADTDSIQLRVIDVATALNTYTVTPTITVAEISTPTQLSHTEYPKQNFYIGPFETATKKYTPMVDQSGHFLVMMGTTTASPVDANWSLQDTATFVGQIESVYCVEEGTNIYIATMSTNGRIAYHVFSTSTDAWTVEDELVEMPGVIGTYDTAPAIPACAIIYRTTGPDVMLYAVVDDGGQDKIHAWEKNAGSWTAIGLPQDVTGGVVAGQFNPSNAATVFVKGTTGDELRRTRHFDGDADLEGAYWPDTTTDNATIITIPGGDEDTDGEVVYIDADNQLSIVQGASVQSTTVSANTVFGHGRTTAPFVSGSLVRNGSDWHVLYIDDTTQNIRHSESIGDRISWGSDTEILDETGVINRLSARLDDAGTGINYVYEEGSTVKFGNFPLEVTVGATTVLSTSAVGTPKGNVTIGLTGVLATATVGTVLPIFQWKSEGFESGSSPDTSFWNATAGSNSTDHAYAGSQSRKFTASGVISKDPSTDQSYAKSQFRFFLDSTSTAVDTNTTMIANMEGSTWNAANAVRLWLTLSGIRYYLGLSQGGSSGPSDFEIQLDTWYLVEFEVNAPNGSARFSVDGDIKKDLTGLTTTGSDINKVRACGLTGFQDTVWTSYADELELWFDSVPPPASIALTGVQSTSAVDTPKGNISVGLTGVLATAAVGTLTLIKSIALTGVLATSSIGSVGFTESGTVGTTGVVNTSAIGSVTQSRTVGLSGVQATSAVGTVAPSVSASAELTGIESTSAVGTVTESHSGSAILTGVQGTSNVGSVGFTESGTVGLTGNIAASAVGTVGTSVGGSQTLTGIVSTSAVGDVVPDSGKELTGNASVGAVNSPLPDTDVSITGEQSTSAVGALGFTESGTVGITGVVSTSAIGTVTASNDGSAELTGIQGTSAEGNLFPVLLLDITGEELTSNIGAVTPNTTVNITGVLSTSAAGAVGFTESGNVGLTGNEVVSAVGTVEASAGSTVEMTGVVSTTAVDTLDKTNSLPITGILGTSAVGTVTPSLSTTLISQYRGAFRGAFQRIFGRVN